MWIDGRGWKLVPVEPTPEMLVVGAKQVDWYAHNALECYHAMLAAAPTPPAQAEASILIEAAHWLHAAYDRPPQTPESAAMLARVDAAIDAAMQRTTGSEK